MSTMVERVARAIFADYHNEGVIHGDFDMLLPTIQDSLRSAARAAIEVMREPTEAMIASGAEVPIQTFEGTESTVLKEQAGEIFAVMIDAALKEEEV